MANKISAQEKEGLLEYNYKIIKQNKKFLFLLFAGLFIIYSFLFGLWKIPVVNFGIDRMSAVGIWDYFFLFGVSGLFSLFITLWKYEKKQRIANSNFAVGGAGGIGAFVAGICPACQGVILVAFGTTLLNIQTAFLVPYLGVIKTTSLGLLMLAVYLKADSIYTKTCKACLISSSKGSKNKGRQNGK